MLEEKGKACIVRPTGFGKTGLLASIAMEYVNEGKKVLFLYPQDTVKQAALHFCNINEEDADDYEENGIRFMTYAKLRRVENYYDFADYKLAITDECHKIGAEKTSESLKQLLFANPDMKLLGATATPDRMDLSDIVKIFFDGNVVSEYTLHNAFQDRVLHKPYYCFCTYTFDDIVAAEKETRLQIELMDKEDREEAEKLLSSRLIEISNLLNMSNIIKETCDQYAVNTSYMKFIVFFSNFAHIKDKGDDVIQWFKDSYPDHDVRALTITSQTKETHDNVKLIDSLTPQENTIDLIFCVDMMTMGYHTPDLTGIIMYRGTQSGIVYAQQLGRVLSSGDMDGGIVFDLVDNLHRESLYDVLGERSKKTIKRKERWLELKEKREAALAANTTNETNPTTNDNLFAEDTSGSETALIGQTIETEEIGTDGLTNEERHEYVELERAFVHEWYNHANDLMPEDLIATGHEAAYRELIAKTVAEPVSMRCRKAWALWIERGGSAQPFTKDHVLSQGKTKNTGVPLSPFARLKNVSVEAVLQEMGL